MPHSYARQRPARSTRPRPPARPPRTRTAQGQRPGQGQRPARTGAPNWTRRWPRPWPTPAPEPVTFGALGLPGPLVSRAGPGRHRAAVRDPGPGTAGRAGRPGRARPGADRVRQDARVRPGHADPAGRAGGPDRAPARTAPRGAHPGADQGTGPAGGRRAAAARQRRSGSASPTVYGGAPIGRQIDRLRRGVDVVVATPGRLIDLMDRHACTLGAIEITVLDEADHMADLGFLPAVTRILDATPAGGQRMLFSATLDRDVERLVTRYLTEPGAARGSAGQRAAARPLSTRVFVLPAQDKLAIAAEIASRPGRTLFFVRTKHGAARLAKQLSRAGVDAAAIHGNLQPEPAAARAGRVRRRAAPGAGRHRRGRPRAGHRGRGPGGALRPAQRPQGLPAPLRPDGPGRGARHGGRVRRPGPGQGRGPAARRGRHHPGPASGRSPGTRPSGTSPSPARRSRSRPSPWRRWPPRAGPPAGSRTGSASRADSAPAGGGDTGRVPRCVRPADRPGTGVRQKKGPELEGRPDRGLRTVTP